MLCTIAVLMLELGGAVAVLVAQDAQTSSTSLPGFSIKFARCSAPLQAEVNRLLPIEAADGWPGGSVTVTCLDDGHIQIFDAGGTIKRDVTTRVSDVSSSGRMVALLLGELLRAPRETIAPVVEAKALSKATAPPFAPPTAASPTDTSLRLFGQLLGEASRDSVPLGGGFGIASQSYPSHRLRLLGVVDLAYDRAQATSVLGTALSETYAADVMPGVGWRFGPTLVSMGPVVRAGLAHVKGKAAPQGATAKEAWAPLLAVGARFEIAWLVGNFGVQASWQTGYGFAKTTGRIDNTEPVQIGGLASFVRLGVQWNLSKP